MTNDEEIRRGNEAAQLMDHPMLQEAFKSIEDEVIHQWRISPARDQEAREKLYLMQSMLSRVKLHIRSVMETGMLAATTAQQKSNRATGRSTLLDS